MIYMYLTLSPCPLPILGPLPRSNPLKLYVAGRLPNSSKKFRCSYAPGNRTSPALWNLALVGLRPLPRNP